MISPKAAEKPLVKNTEEVAKVVSKTKEPLGAYQKSSAFSITAALNQAEEKPAEITQSQKQELPSQHFSDTDLQNEWKKFLQELQQNDIIIYNAISSFKLNKKNEHIVEITYPSESAKAEFEKVRSEFYNHFMHKVSNYNIIVEYRVDITMKKEIITKRKIFDKFAEINPVLRDLDHEFKLDFN